MSDQRRPTHHKLVMTSYQTMEGYPYRGPRALSDMDVLKKRGHMILVQALKTQDDRAVIYRVLMPLAEPPEGSAL